MNPLTPSRLSPRSTIAIVCAFALLFVLASLADRPIYHALLTSNRELLESRDWYRALRILGFLPTWLVAALAFMLADSARPYPASGERTSPIWSRGPYLALSATLAGALAEGLKLLFRRARPIDTDGVYHFVPFSHRTFQTSDLGIPSSHAAVAFAAAFALARLHPRTICVLLPVAIGCGLTRMLTGQHFASDVVAGAFIGWLLPIVITALHDRGR